MDSLERKIETGERINKALGAVSVSGVVVAVLAPVAGLSGIGLVTVLAVFTLISGSAAIASLVVFNRIAGLRGKLASRPIDDAAKRWGL